VTPAAYQQLTAQIKDIVRLEQYLDFLRNRSFRMTLLVKKGVPVQRSLPGSRVKSFWIASDLQWCRPLFGEGAEMATQQQPAEFKTRRGLLLKVASPLTAAALQLLQEQFPLALQFADLLQRARRRLGLWAQQAGLPQPQPQPQPQPDEADADSENTLANDLLALYTKPAAIEFFTAPPPVGQLDKLAGAFPLASAYARWQASSTARLTNLRHETVTVGELERKLLPWLDGQHSWAALQTALQAMVQGTQPTELLGGTTLGARSSDAEFAQALTRLLESLAAHSFLCGPAA
jgi:methyltransferase-like protein